MNKLGRGLLAALLLASSTAQTALKNDRTFLAHRDDISNLGMDWVTKNHYQGRGDHTNMGGLFTVTPFFSTSTNDKDLSRLFGIGTTSQINVTKGTRPTRANQHSALYSFNIDHSPNSDGTTAGQIPMSGTVNLKPQRQVWGAHLGWDQSLDTVLKGLRFSLRAPLTKVSTSMKASFPVKVASAIPPVDGGIADIDEYFKGDFSKTLAGTNTHVTQYALTRQKFDGKWHNAVGIGDVVASLHWGCYNARRFSLGVSASVQLPTGNASTGEWLFEPITGGRGHTAAGLGANIRLKGFSKGALQVNFDIVGDWKYYFKGVEKRTLGIDDSTLNTSLVAGSYRNMVEHKYPGVFPSANVLTTNTDVTPGHQFEGLAGMSASWYNWTFDVGYNLYIHEKEKVEHKAWTDDKYAVAHNRYSAHTSALGTTIIGGNVVDGDDPSAAASEDALGSGSWDDPRSPVTKHQNRIGANGDAWAAGLAAVDGNVADSGLNSDDVYPPANFSMHGPVQAPGKTTSALPARSSFFDADGLPISARVDSTGSDTNVFGNDTENDDTIVTGVDIDVAGAGTGVFGTDSDGLAQPATLTPRYNITTANSVTEQQITHSVVGGLGYKFSGNYPIVASIGAQGEFQDGNHNSALEGWKVWMKFGMNF